MSHLIHFVPFETNAVYFLHHYKKSCKGGELGKKKETAQIYIDYIDYPFIYIDAYRTI